MPSFPACCIDWPMPKKFKFTLPTPSDGTCSVCEGFAGDYILDQYGACYHFLYQGTAPGPACWGVDVTLTILGTDYGPARLRVEFMDFTTAKKYVYIKDVADFTSQAVTLNCQNTTAAPDCTFPATATIEALDPPDLTELRKATCLAPFCNEPPVPSAAGFSTGMSAANAGGTVAQGAVAEAPAPP